jgi:hypothetical protein
LSLSKETVNSAVAREIVAELRNEGHVDENVRGTIRLTPRARTIHHPTLTEADEASLREPILTFLRISNDFPMPDLEDQLVWSASLGLDLADRPVLEAEVLIWRIVQQRSMQHSLNQRESDFLS